MQRPTSSLRPESSLFLQSAVDDDDDHADADDGVHAADDGDHYHSQLIIIGILILLMVEVVKLVLIVVLILTVVLVMKVMIGLAGTHLCISSRNSLRATKGIIMGWGCGQLLHTSQTIPKYQI